MYLCCTSFYFLEYHIVPVVEAISDRNLNGRFDCVHNLRNSAIKRAILILFQSVSNFLNSSSVFTASGVLQQVVVSDT